MKKLFLAFGFLLSAFVLKAQEVPPYNRTTQNVVLADRATLAHYFMGVPHGTSPAMPGYVPDSVKAGGLYYDTADTSLMVYNPTTGHFTNYNPNIANYLNLGGTVSQTFAPAITSATSAQALYLNPLFHAQANNLSFTTLKIGQTINPGSYTGEIGIGINQVGDLFNSFAGSTAFQRYVKLSYINALSPEVRYQDTNKVTRAAWFDLVNHWTINDSTDYGVTFAVNGSVKTTSTVQMTGLPSTGTSAGVVNVDASGNLFTASPASAGVSTFDTRAGAVTLNSTDVTAALGFTPENVANKETTVTNSTSLYPTGSAVESYITGLGYAYNLVPTAVKTSAYTAAPSDFIPVNTTSGAVTITLPNAPADKTRVGVKLVIQSGTNAVTINTAGSDVINKTGGGTSGTLSLMNQGVIYQYSASGGIWYVISDDLPLSPLDTRYAPIFAGTGYSKYASGTLSYVTAIPNADLANSTISGVSLGSNLATLTFGSHITGTSYNGSSAVTIATDASSTPAAGILPLWDANINFSANSFMFAGTQTVSAGGNTTLTVSSSQYQYVTGTTGQIMTLPVVSTLKLYQMYAIWNTSTGTTTVNSSGGNTLATLSPNQVLFAVCTSLSGTGTASWSYYIDGTSVGSLTAANTWNQEQTLSATGTALNVTNGNIAVANGGLTSSWVYASYKTGMAYAINTGGSTYGGIGNTSINNQFGLGYNTGGPGNAFTGTALLWNSYNQVIFQTTAQLHVYTVSTLPSTNLQAGQMTAVSDQSGSPTFLGSLTGGGTIFTPVVYTGSSWVAF